MLEKREVLGERLYVSVYVVRSVPPPEEMEILLKKAVAFIGMDTASLPPKTWVYPLSDGRGGVGETICQPLVESFVLSDSWRDEVAGGCEFQGWLAAG